MTELLGYAGALLVGAAVVAVVAGFARPRRPALADRLGVEEDTPAMVDLRQRALNRELGVRLSRPAIERLSGIGRRITLGGRGDALRVRLDHAGITTPPEWFLAAKACSVGVGVVLGVLWGIAGGPRPVVAVIVLTVVGYLAPELLLRQRGQKRQEAITRTLPEALDLLALTVQAGLGFEQGIDEVTAEVTGPLGDEFDRMLREQQLGRSRNEALRSLQHRNSSDDLRTLCAALLHADRLGTPIASTLQTQSRELRRKRRADARERAGKAPVKLLFPLIFGVFPAMFVIIIGPAALQIFDALLR